MNDELIIRVISGAASPDECRELLLWRMRAPGHEAYFQETLRVWTATEPTPLDRDDVQGRTRTITEEADARTRNRCAYRSTSRSVRGGVLLPRQGLALAATVAAIALGLRLASSPSPAEPVAVWEARGPDPRTVALSDGSLVRIAPGARLSRMASGYERRFSLQGRAFFAVAHRDRHPFVVEAEGIEIRDLGTRFQVDFTPEGLRAVVLEGSVELSAPAADPVVVGGGAVAVVARGGTASVEHPEDIYDLLDWPNGVLLFQATPLHRVAGEVARRFGRVVTVEGAAVRSRRISAWFTSESFEEVVGAICQAAGVPCAISDSTAVIGAR